MQQIDMWQGTPPSEEPTANRKRKSSTKKRTKRTPRKERAARAELPKEREYTTKRGARYVLKRVDP